MNQAEIIKDYIIYLYKHHPNIHVNIRSKQLRDQEFRNVPVTITGVYPNIFEIKEKNEKKPKRYTFQYVDVVTREIEVIELSGLLQKLQPVQLKNPRVGP